MAPVADDGADTAAEPDAEPDADPDAEPDAGPAADAGPETLPGADAEDEDDADDEAEGAAVLEDVDDEVDAAVAGVVDADVAPPDPEGAVETAADCPAEPAPSGCSVTVRIAYWPNNQPMKIATADTAASVAPKDRRSISLDLDLPRPADLRRLVACSAIFGPSSCGPPPYACHGSPAALSLRARTATGAGVPGVYGIHSLSNEPSPANSPRTSPTK